MNHRRCCANDSGKAPSRDTVASGGMDGRGGASTASQTAWALIGLHAAGEQGPVSERAIRYLVETQGAGGGWDEPYYTGTGFPGDFYLNYHLYRDVFPVMALGRVLA